VAISAIQVLKAFMNIGKDFNERMLLWLVIIHLVFVVSGIVLAWTDAIAERGKHGAEPAHAKNGKKK
jgi:uncharacterized protein (TIGR00645 family)